MVAFIHAFSFGENIQIIFAEIGMKSDFDGTSEEIKVWSLNSFGDLKAS